MLISQLQEDLTLNSKQVEMALKEMHIKGLIQKAMTDSVSPNRSVFFNFDKYTQGYDPQADALVVAKRLLTGDNGAPSYSCETMAQELGWPPRRMNAAVQYLLFKGVVDHDQNSAYPWLMFWLRANENIQSFVDA